MMTMTPLVSPQGNPQGNRQEVRHIRPGNQLENPPHIPRENRGESQQGNRREDRHQDLLELLTMLPVRRTRDAVCVG